MTPSGSSKRGDQCDSLASKLEEHIDCGMLRRGFHGFAFSHAFPIRTLLETFETLTQLIFGRKRAQAGHIQEVEEEPRVNLSRNVSRLRPTTAGIILPILPGSSISSLTDDADATVPQCCRNLRAKRAKRGKRGKL